VPTIPFKLSLTARLENVLTHLMTNVDRVSNNLNALFDDENRAALKSTLADVASLAHALAAQKGTLSAGIADAARMAHTAASAAKQLTPTLERIAGSARAVERMADSAGAASVRAALAADAAASGVQQIGSQTLPELSRLMAELSQLSASLRRLSEQTAGHPDSLLIGRPTTPPGPGERAPP
jgi:phospholipid/cholesterol/gamma-HCH transport system substrate-binding protein